MKTGSQALRKPSAGVLLALLFATACGGPEPPSIVLISIDTLRSDRLPAYGYRAIATPHLDALRADSILFERAYSPTPTTLPAHASMLTGLLPPDHGVRGNVGYTLDSARLPYLPELLRRAGYATGAAVASFVMRRETGLAAGFDLYEDAIDYRANAGSAGFQRSGPETLTAILPWLREAERPLFLFLHLYDPHSPYIPPEPYASRYPSPYDGEIAVVDEVIGELVAELRRLGLYDDAVVLFTSDHGEGLGDHGESEHGIFVYREALQVPLLLKLPGLERAGESVAAPAQLADVFPTLLALGGAASGESTASDARSLLDLGTADLGRRIWSETFFPRFYFGWSELISVIEGHHHYIDSPEPELYDLAADPEEKTNLSGSGLEVERVLRRVARSYERKLVDPADADFETWSKLASLGYVGHGQTRVDVELPAPASQVHLLAKITAGLTHAMREEFEAAASVLAEVVAENPHALVAWEQLGRSLERLGRSEEALAAYLRALAISGSAPHLLLGGARAALRTGELEQAAELARGAVGWDEAEARTLLADIALRQGNFEDAESQARAAADLRVPNTPALFTLAQARLRRGKLEAALEAVREVEAAVAGPVPRLGILRFNILASMERFEEAEHALRREIDDYPHGIAAYPRLALFLARRGRPQEAVDTLRKLVEANPNPAGYRAAVKALELLGDPQSAAVLLDEARRRFPESVELQPG